MRTMDQTPERKELMNPESDENRELDELPRTNNNNNNNNNTMDIL